MTPSTIRTFARGPQFGGRFSIVFLILAILLFFSGINSMRDDDWIYAAGMLISSVVLLTLFLDYRGVQIDLEGLKIRTYRSFLGIRYGTWRSMEGYEKLLLKWERTAHRTGSPTISFMSMSGSQKRTDDAYCIYLVNPSTNDRIEFIDFSTYKGARHFIKKLSNELNMTFEDSYKVIRERAYQRRLERERRP